MAAMAFHTEGLAITYAAVSTSSGIEKRLPAEVITSILNQSDTTNTCMKWLKAAGFHEDILSRAIVAFYEHFVLHKERLLEDFDPTTGKVLAGDGHLEVIRAIRSRAGRRIRNGTVFELPTGAIHMKSLLLNCQHGYEEVLRASDLEYMRWEATFRRLLPAIADLERLNHYGPLHNGRMWNDIMELDALQFLAIRQVNYLGDDATLIGKHNNQPTVLHNFERLSSLKDLRELKVGRLLSAEAQSLASAIRIMPALHYLEIEAAPAEWVREVNKDVGLSELVMPLAHFLQHLFHHGPLPWGLPYALKQLKLKDNRHQGRASEYDFLQSGHMGRWDDSDLLSELTHLYCDSPNEYFALRMLYRLKLPTLAELTASSLPAEQLSSQVFTFEKLLSKLERITILDCQSNTGFLHSFFSKDSDLQYMQYGLQLRLVLPPTNLVQGQANDVPKTCLLSKILDPHLSPSGIPYYGLHLRHLCITNIRYSQINFDKIDLPEMVLQDLRVLIIRERASIPETNSPQTLEFKPYLTGRLGLPLPYQCDESNDQGYQAALNIAGQNLPSLQLLGIRGKWYRIEHSVTSGPVKSYRNRVWKLEYALENAEQKQKMKSDMVELDWTFARDDSDAVGRFPSAEQCQVGNSLVLYKKIDDLEGIEQAQKDREKHKLAQDIEEEEKEEE